MASILERLRKNGTPYLVRWRDRGVQDCMTLPSREQAEMWKALSEANGHSLRAAERAVQNAGLGGPTVVQLLHKRISFL